MKIHKEGYPTLILVFIVIAITNFIVYTKVDNIILFIVSLFITLDVFGFFLLFFRMPTRITQISDNQIVCPADGKVVVIEETVENEYLKDRRIQVSIFMSPLNVHANWYPANGKIKYVKHHKGKYLVAWDPKSSTNNERSTVVLEHKNGTQILVRQIAGAVARRIVTYAKPREYVKVNQELGFIKFGSRVDIFLPLGTDIKVNLEDNVVGNQTILAEL